MAMIIGLVLMSQSCEEGFIPSDRDELIVEGWIDAGGFPVVIITHSLPVRLKEEGIKVSQIAKFMETSAKVTVSDGETSSERSDRREPQRHSQQPDAICNSGGSRKAQ